ncbi:MAG: YggS family pyridoxal phosphate-dependent enzyme, partial [Bacteroidia bacterium]
MIKQNLEKIKQQLPHEVQLVVVSKFRSIDELREVYETGQREFAENRVQEMVEKFNELPKDINWHLIGHLQSNKVKYIAPFVRLIHSVDSLELAQEINKQAIKNNRTISVLLQFHVAQEDSKFGLKPEDAESVCQQILELSNIEILGIMGMATFTMEESLIRKEFKILKSIFKNL